MISTFYKMVFILSSLGIGSIAAAVQSISIQERWNKSTKSIVFPVFWEKSISDFRHESVITETEHFRERWTFHMDVGLEMRLSSPRGTVEVSGLYYSDGIGSMPRKIVLEKKDFALLFGVNFPDSSEKEGESSDPELVILALGSNMDLDQKFYFGIESDQYLQIHFSLIR